MSQSKVNYAFEQNVCAFLERNAPNCYFWTFTFASNETDAKVAYRSFAPFQHLVERRRGEYIAVWERQERGAWHVHVLTNIFFEHSFLAPWLQERGWGFSFVKRCEQKLDYEGIPSWKPLARYLLKYLDRRRPWGAKKKGSMLSAVLRVDILQDSHGCLKSIRQAGFGGSVANCGHK